MTIPSDRSSAAPSTAELDRRSRLARSRLYVARPTASPRELWDWVYLQTIRNDLGDMLAIAKRLKARIEQQPNMRRG